MTNAYLRRLAKILGVESPKPVRRRKLNVKTLNVENLENRDLLTALAWASGENLPAATAGLAVQPAGSNLLVIPGDSTAAYYLTAANASWQATTSPTNQPIDFARTSPGEGPLPNGLYIIYGGTQNGFATSAVTQYDPNTITVVDGSTNQTRALHAMNTPRALLGGATDPSTYRSYAIGGEDNNGTPLASVEVYNPTANTWTNVAALPETLYSESAVSDGAGHIYAFGGVGANGAITNNVYRYTIATNTWDQVASLQVGVRDSAAVLGSNGLIDIIGGTTASGTTATVQSYNIATNTWTLSTSLPQAVSSEAAVVDSLGRIEVLGGYDANGNPTAAVYTSQQFTQPDLAPTIKSPAPTTAVLNGNFSYQVTSTANPQATFSLSTAPAGMTIDPNTGLVSWTPTALGSYSVTVLASNGAGQASQSFSVNIVLPTPAAPSGLTGMSLSPSTVLLSWNASTDPYVTSYDVYQRHVLHDPKGSGSTTYYSLVAAGITGTSVTLGGSGVYSVTAVNSAGTQSARSANLSVSTTAAPVLFTAATTSGADISSLTLNVGQTEQIDLVQEFANPAPTFSVVSGPSGITVDPATGLVTYTPAPADIGNQPVVFAATNSAGTSRYTFYFNVLALNPTLTVASGELPYDGNTHAVSATAVGSDGTTPVAGSFAITYNGSPILPQAAGTYAVQATFTSADPSYASAVVSGTFTIDPAVPALSLNSGTFDFDGNAHAAAPTALGVDGVTPVNGNFVVNYNGDSTPPTVPGLYSVAALFISNDPNYASVIVTGNLIINSPGTLTPTLSLIDGSAIYDGNPHADSAVAVAADGVTPVAGDFIITYNGSPIAPTQAGNYAVSATFVSSDPNYAGATISGTLTIGSATPTLAVDPNPFTYDGTSRAALVSAIGVDQVTPVDGTFSVTYDGSPDAPVNAGTYEVTVGFSSNDPNYQSTSTTSSITILPATPSVGLGNGGQWEFTYDGTPQSVVGSAVGIDGLTPISGTFSYSYYNEYGSNTQLFGSALPGAPVNAGYYTFVETFTSRDPNYADGTFSWNLWIDPASPTVTINGGPFTYSGATPSGIVSAVGIDGATPVAGTTTYITYNGSTTAPTAAGTYDVYAEFTSSDPNYYSSTAAGTLVINKATPAFSSLSSPAVNLGASTATVTGHIAAGSVAPGGDDVAITLGGVTQSVAIGSSGSFSTSFSIAALQTGTYPITYKFLGDATRFNAASSGSGTLTVQAAPSILFSPLSQSVVGGSSVIFSAGASGYPAPSVQWQQSTNGRSYANIAGATGNTYTIASASASQNGYRYRAVFTNSVGSATTAVATLTVQAAPVVTTNPTNQAVNAGQTATFTAAATGSPAPTVQWQVSTNGGSTFSPVAGATSTKLTLSATTASQSGSVYRAVFTSSAGSVTTATATLIVRFAPAVASSPTGQTIAAGQSVTFTAAATGSPTPTVQWQQSTNGGASFSNISGATSSTYTIGSVIAGQNGYLYRAVFTNSAGSATTAAATLTVQSAPAVTKNPTSQTVSAGQSATLTATAAGNPPLSVQWQSSSDGGVTYANVAGATSATLAFTSVTASQNGLKYRAVFTNALGSATTLAATLNVRYAPAVTVNPANQSVTAGSSASFTAAATANPASTVQWQVSTNGGTSFTNISGATSATYIIARTTLAQNGYLYRALFTNSIGSTTSLVATLIVK